MASFDEGYYFRAREAKTRALIQAVYKWKDGYLNYEKPNEEEVNKCLLYLQSLLAPNHVVIEDDEVDYYLNLLLSYDIIKHFEKVASHRRWIRFAHELLLNADVYDLHDGLKERIENHDLSKYGPSEALGYSIMFAKHNKTHDDLLDWEKDEWHRSKMHHHMYNKHHPEMTKYTGEEMTELDLQESLLDMIACRFERELQHFKVSLSYSYAFVFSRHYFERYNKAQRDYIEEKIKMYTWGLHNLISIPTILQSILHEEWVKKTGIRFGCVTCQIK